MNNPKIHHQGVQMMFGNALAANQIPSTNHVLEMILVTPTKFRNSIRSMRRTLKLFLQTKKNSYWEARNLHMSVYLRGNM